MRGLFGFYAYPQNRVLLSAMAHSFGPAGETARMFSSKDGSFGLGCCAPQEETDFYVSDGQAAGASAAVICGNIYDQQSPGMKIAPEALTRLYEERGPGFLRDIDGEFAAALWDGRRKKLLLARDPFGTKCIYYSRSHDGIVFASNIKAILAAGCEAPEVNEETLVHYFHYNYSPAPQTMFEGIFKLKPGHFAEFDAGGPFVEKEYWDVSFAPRQEAVSEDEAVLRIHDLFLSAVKKRASSLNRVGVFFSGGKDSTTVVAYLKKLEGLRVTTLNIAIRDEAAPNSQSDADAALGLARFYKTEHIEVPWSQQDFLDSLEIVAGRMDDLAMFRSACLCYALSRAAKEHGLDAVLTGEGRDTIFAGDLGSYRKINSLPMRILQRIPRHFLKKLVGAGRRVCPSSAWLQNKIEWASRVSRGQELYEGRQQFFLDREKTGLFTAEFIGRHRGLDPDSIITDALAHLSLRQKPALHEKILYLNLKGYYPERCVLGHRQAADSSEVDERMPFFDRALFEFVCGLPEEMKSVDRRNRLFGRMVADVIPGPALRRKKAGLQDSMAPYVSGRKFALRAREVILSSRILKKDYFNRAAVENMLSRHLQEKENDGKRIFHLYLLCSWYDKNFYN